jgi:hypothetical protein
LSVGVQTNQNWRLEKDFRELHAFLLDFSVTTAFVFFCFPFVFHALFIFFTATKSHIAEDFGHGLGGPVGLGDGLGDGLVAGLGRRRFGRPPCHYIIVW